MNRIYSVQINGRTFESRNLKELLARAVSVKRNIRQGRGLRTNFNGKISTEKQAGSYSESEMVAAH